MARLRTEVTPLVVSNEREYARHIHERPGPSNFVFIDLYIPP